MNESTRVRRLLASLVVVVVTMSGFPVQAAGLNLELPDLDNVAAHSADTGVDSKTGLQILRKMRGQLPVIEDPELNRWFQDLGRRLAARSGYSGKIYFLLVNDSDVNAFANLGGVIVVNSGLVLQADSEDEVAAVVAHEIAHISQRHIHRMIANAKKNLVGTSAAVLAGLLAASQDPQASQAIVTTVLATARHRQLQYSRSMESEADSVGIRILAGAGFDPQGMPKFMEKLDRLSDQFPAQFSKFLQSHPLSIERVADTRSRADRLGYRNRSNPEFFYIRERLRALTTRGGVQRTANDKSPQVAAYAKGLQLTRSGKLVEGQKALARAGGSLPVKLAQAENFYQQRKYQRGIQLLRPLLSRYYGEEQLIIPLANHYMAAGQASKAWELFRNVVPSELTSLGYFDVRQEAASLVRRTGEAYLAAAERNIRIGNYKHARLQLDEALRLPYLDEREGARIRQRLNEIKNDRV